MPEILREVLAKRGIVGPEAIDRFFNPSIAALSPPDCLTGVSEAAELLLDEDGKIVVFGDYDCDGVCASAILTSVLGKLGKDVSPFLPERLSEGYGMSAASVSRMFAEHPGVKLVVTVDNGVNSVDEVAALREKGIKVVVTDHHLPGAVLPECEALVDPKVSSSPELADLCGAGVAFMVAAALVKKARERGLYSGPNLVAGSCGTCDDNRSDAAFAAEPYHRFRGVAQIPCLRSARNPGTLRESGKNSGGGAVFARFRLYAWAAHQRFRTDCFRHGSP